MGHFVHIGNGSPDNQAQKENSDAYGQQAYAKLGPPGQSRVNLVGVQDIIRREPVQRGIHRGKQADIALKWPHARHAGQARHPTSRSLAHCLAKQPVGCFTQRLAQTFIGLLFLVSAQQKLAQKNLEVASFPFFRCQSIHAQRAHSPGIRRKIGHQGGKIGQGRT